MTTYEAYECMKRASGICDNSTVAQCTGLSPSTFSDWKQGRSEPKLEKIYKICKYFNVPIDTFCELVYDD